MIISSSNKDTNKTMKKVYDLYRNEFSQMWFQFILDNPDKNWDWFELSANPNITLDIVYGNPHINWNYKQISKGIYITQHLIRDNPSIKWDYYMLSRNPTLTWDVVCQHPTKKWCYKWLSMHNNIHWEIVCQHPEKPWNSTYLSMNPNITWDIVQQHPEIQWDYQYLSRNPTITRGIVEANINKDWNFYCLKENPNVLWEIDEDEYDSDNVYTYINNTVLSYETLMEMLENPDNCVGDLYYISSTVKYVDLSYLSSQPNITWDIVRDNPDREWDMCSSSRWNYPMLSGNPMTAWKQRFILEKLKERRN